VKRIGSCFLWCVAAVAAGPYAGSQACAPCHRREFDRQTLTRHAGALRPISQSPVADVLLNGAPPDATVRYASRGDGISATVRQNGAEAAAVLEWAFGAGAQGITPVGRAGEQYLEHRFSYYAAAGHVLATFGHPQRAATPLAMLGLPQSARTITACFQCHATGVENTARGPDLSAMQPGVQCERCHGPGRRHMEIANAGGRAAEVRRAVLNPGQFPAKAQVEICGECHRLPAPGSTVPEPEVEDPIAVRFAPVGLMASRCFLQSKHLACTTCHDPHEDARARTDASYTAGCTACHAAAPKIGSACRRAAGEACLPCHMRQASLGPYLKFTDHRIRVY
jgi:hypothetical protein